MITVVYMDWLFSDVVSIENRPKLTTGIRVTNFFSMKHVQFKEDFRLSASIERVWKLHAFCYGLHISILTNTILDIFHCPVLYLKHNIFVIGFCLRLQVEPTQLGPIVNS
jgi:hypothetical protein